MRGLRAILRIAAVAGALALVVFAATQSADGASAAWSWPYYTTTTQARTTTTVRSTPTTLAPTTTTTVRSTTTTTASSGVVNVRDYGATPNDSTNDAAAIGRAISAAASQGKVTYIPAGRYIANSIVVPSGAKIKGDGASSIVVDGSSDHSGRVFWAINASNVTISDLAIQGTDTGTMKADVGIIFGNSYNNVVERVTFNYLAFAVRIGSDGSAVGNGNITIRDSKALSGNHTFLFAAYVTGLTLSGDDLDSYTGDASGTSHQLYFAKEVNTVNVSNTTFRRGSNYSVQIYPDTGLRNMTFTNVTFADVRAGVIVSPGSAITFNGVTASSTRYAADAWFNLDGSNITVQNFNISGASSLVSASGSGIVFRDGTYTGTRLGSGASFVNVN